LSNLRSVLVIDFLAFVFFLFGVDLVWLLRLIFAYTIFYLLIVTSLENYGLGLLKSGIVRF